MKPRKPIRKKRLRIQPPLWVWWVFGVFGAPDIGYVLWAKWRVARGLDWQ